MAHIGVLKVLENQVFLLIILLVRVWDQLLADCMLSAIPQQRLIPMVRTQDWGLRYQIKVDTKHQSLEERQNRTPTFLSKPLSINKTRSEQAGGIIYGQNLTNLFSKLTVGYRDSIDFNALPIPFACVATNEVDNSEVDFHSGWQRCAPVCRYQPFHTGAS